jgi:hypothetical protein
MYTRPSDGVKKVTELSQMPCRISTDAHEWINEVPTVPAYGPVNPPPGEQSRDTQREEKTLWTEE